jgi:photosystem II stability/assembly factor-like uncharacterized protein
MTLYTFYNRIIGLLKSRSLRIVFVFLVILVASHRIRGYSLVQAGDNTWTPLGLYGVTILDIAVAPNNDQVVYAVTNSQNFILKSIDAGITWQPVLSNYGMDWGSRILFDPITPDIIYVIGMGTLYISQNAGGNWETKNINVPVEGEGGVRINSSAISPINGALYISTGSETGNRIFRSLNHGDTWVSLALPNSGIGAIAIAPSAPHIMYAGGSYAIYKSIDSGDTWQRAEGGFAVPPSDVYSIAVDPYDAQVVYIGTGDNGIFKSSNGGQSWISIGDGLSTNCIRDILINPGNQQVIYVGGGTPSFFPSNPGIPGIYRSLDNTGASWASMMEGMGSKAIRSLAITGSVPRTIFTGTEGNGIWKYILTSGPQDFSISINNGALFTNQTAVTLTLTAPSGTKDMIINNDGGFGGVPWESFVNTKSWTITSYGSSVIPRTVYAKFKIKGEISGVYQDDIILDQTPPMGTIIITDTFTATAKILATLSVYSPEMLSATTAYTEYLPLVSKNYLPGFRLVGLSLSATDDVSGVDSMLISNDVGFAGAQWQAYAQKMNWYVNEKSTTTVYIKFRDRAGNESLVYSTITPTQ